jgi:hypothetical protein
MFLPWVMDYNTMRLTCKITDDLEYEAFDGGLSSFTKTYKGVTTELPISNWHPEKEWLSENYGDILGKFEPNYTDVFIDPQGRPAHHKNGTDPDGRRFDHMQRSAALMLCQDMASIGMDGFTEYETPDCGLTIYKRLPIAGSETKMPSPQQPWYTDHAQPCHMRPKIYGRKLSSYEELSQAGISQDIIDRCKQGKFDPAPRPDLQKYFVYPTN